MSLWIYDCMQEQCTANLLLHTHSYNIFIGCFEYSCLACVLHACSHKRQVHELVNLAFCLITQHARSVNLYRMRGHHASTMIIVCKFL